MKNFDVFAAIDWSGAQNPVKTRAIALAIANAGSKAPHVMGHVWSRTTIADWIIDQANLDHRMLIGIDCNFSYSRQVTDRQFETPYQARDLWHLVDRVSQSEANYYAGPYWSDKRYKDLFWLSGTKEPGHELPLRETEKACYQAGLGRPESPFKLIGAKQVGKAGLSGMRLLADLKRKLGRRVAVWPFDEHINEANLIITEIYPALFIKMSGFGHKKIRSNQTLSKLLSTLKSEPVDMEATFSDHQADAVLSAAGLRLLCGTATTVPSMLARPNNVSIDTLQKEGWIFGV